MPAADDPGKLGTLPADHAGSVLCRLLISHPDVIDIEILGQSEVIDGITSYSLGVLLPGGRELYIDVEDAAEPVRAQASRRQPTPAP
ncbi:MAG TPA: hypothetical protein VMH35_19685 [Streptosporangiaceae bacterium]|nr:hypothetical protein [Streptosporangiaceae bacterium]